MENEAKWVVLGISPGCHEAAEELTAILGEEHGTCYAVEETLVEALRFGLAEMQRRALGAEQLDVSRWTGKTASRESVERARAALAVR
jgi:hypothetical protein